MCIDRGLVMVRSRGFTLIELLVVVAIIAILAAIAYPSYIRYTYRARRVDGQTLLTRIADAEERYYSTYNKYGSLHDVGFDDATSEKGYYSARVPAGASTSSQAFLVEAVPQGVQSADKCGNLSIDSADDRQPDKTDTEANSNGSCW
jgi:type IV pilus assembly protein PilE